jgi:invasion protein IalB
MHNAMHEMHSAIFAKRHDQSSLKSSHNKADNAQCATQNQQDANRTPRRVIAGIIGERTMTRKAAKGACVRSTQHRNGKRGRKND